MDEGYFLYFRMTSVVVPARQGGRCGTCRNRVLHLEGVHGIRARRNVARLLVRFAPPCFVKHHGVCGLLLADLLWAAGRLSFLLLRAGMTGGRMIATSCSICCGATARYPRRPDTTGRHGETRR